MPSKKGDCGLPGGSLLRAPAGVAIRSVPTPHPARGSALPVSPPNGRVESTKRRPINLSPRGLNVAQRPHHGTATLVQGVYRRDCLQSEHRGLAKMIDINLTDTMVTPQSFARRLAIKIRSSRPTQCNGVERRCQPLRIGEKGCMIACKCQDYIAWLR